MLGITERKVKKNSVYWQKLRCQTKTCRIEQISFTYQCQIFQSVRSEFLDYNKEPIKAPQQLSNPVRHQHYFQYGDYCRVGGHDGATLGAARVDEEQLAEEVRTYPILYDKRRVDALLAVFLKYWTHPL